MIHALALTLVSPALAAPAPQGVNIVINEVRIDQPGSDVDEYAELRGTAGMSLDGISYIVIGDGSTASGTIESVTALDGLVMPMSGRFLIAESGFTYMVTPDFVASLGFENSDNVTHVLVEGFTGASGDDLDTDDDGVLDVMPWTSVLDAVSLVENTDTPASGEFFYGSALGGADVGPDGTFVPAHAFRCELDGSWNIGGFTNGTNDTPGAMNSCVADTAPFCTPMPNSFSVDGSFITLDSASGGSLSANDATLTVNDVPDSFGLFIQGSMEAPMPMMAPFGGNICVAGSIQRLNMAFASSGGTASLALDFAGTGPESSTMAGMTVYYQWFHRDTTPGGGNFSEGLAVTWTN